MNFVLSFESDNIEDNLDLNWVMEKVTDAVANASSGDSGPVRDFNGNTIGEWRTR